MSEMIYSIFSANKFGFSLDTIQLFSLFWNAHAFVANVTYYLQIFIIAI